MVALPAAAPSALPYILGIFFLLTPPAPFLSLYTEKVIAALAFPRLPLLYTRPDDDFLDEDDVALFETTAVSLPSSSMSISRSHKKTLVSPIYTPWRVGLEGGWGGEEGGGISMHTAECHLPVLGFTASSFSAVFFCATPSSSVYMYVHDLAFRKKFFSKKKTPPRRQQNTWTFFLSPS